MFSFVESFLISLTVKGLLVIFEKPTNPASLTALVKSVLKWSKLYHRL